MNKDLPLSEVLDELERRYGVDKQPIGATATIKWLGEDSEPVDGYYFSFGESEYNEDTGDYGNDSYGVPDECVFFYCDGEHALKSYMTEGIEDFVVLNYELEYAND
jgi:hypothetical protein